MCIRDSIKVIKKLKTNKTTLCAGNIATAEAARFLIRLGVDIVKVGIGPGSICTTRLVAGIGVIHRNLDIKKQINEIKKVKKLNLLVGAAVGAGPLELKRAEAILKEKVDLIVVDTAHGHSKKVAEIIKAIKKLKTNKTTLCAGNIATAEAAKFLIKLGVDIIKVGIGPGSICTTRLVAGIGVPQLSAILAVKKGVKNNKVKIISDGGIKYSGDLAKALSAGALSLIHI